MIVKGYTEDGCQIQATHGGLHIETSAQRDARLAATRLTQIERAAPEMLAVLQRLLKLNREGKIMARVWGDAEAVVAKATN